MLFNASVKFKTRLSALVKISIKGAHNNKVKALVLSVAGLFFYSVNSQAEPQFLSASNALIIKKVAETHLQVKPAKCVALNEGRTCFANVVFSWQSPEKQSLCIYQKQPKKKIACWHSPAKQEIAFKFKSNQSQIYQLINQEDIILAETMIEVNWVYDAGPRKRRWRVF